jgi:cytochrome c oxidase cbb3-type subunit 1
VKASHPYFVVRLIGGCIFLSGMLIMAYNTWKTITPVNKKPALAAR